METYILRTHLIDSPGVFFYFKGTASEKEVPQAVNTIVGFEPSDALKFVDKYIADCLCQNLNLDKTSLKTNGFSEFEVISLFN